MEQDGRASLRQRDGILPADHESNKAGALVGMNIPGSLP